MDQIRLSGMQFFAYHGALAGERSVGQRFIVNTTLHLDLREAGQSDNLDYSVNYAWVYERVKQVAEGEPVQLIEHLAHQIAMELLDAFPRLLQVDVEVEKPGAPIPGVFGNVSVMLSRTRQ